MDLQNAFGKYLVLCEKDDIIVTENGETCQIYILSRSGPIFYQRG